MPRFDYGTAGSYFLTVCTSERRYLFGEMQNGRMHLSPVGMLVQQELEHSRNLRPEFSFPAYIVMPNHFHALVTISRESGLSHDAERVEQFSKPQKNTVTALLRGLKSRVTSRARQELGWGEERIWQARHWEHVVRSNAEYQVVFEYIIQNPQRWQEDCFRNG